MNRFETAPLWLHLTIVVLAALRLAVLVSADTILDGPRAKLVDRLNRSASEKAWAESPGLEDMGVGAEHLVVKLLACPGWCVGWWTSVLLTCGPWLIWPDVTAAVCSPIAVAGAVGLLMPSAEPEDG